MEPTLQVQLLRFLDNGGFIRLGDNQQRYSRVMLVAAKPIGDFVDAHPSVKVLALAFLVMVGMALTAEAFDQEVPKGYIYAAMAFSLAVEALNIRARTKRQLAAQAAGGH